MSELYFHGFTALERDILFVIVAGRSMPRGGSHRAISRALATLRNGGFIKWERGKYVPTSLGQQEMYQGKKAS